MVLVVLCRWETSLHDTIAGRVTLLCALLAKPCESESYGERFLLPVLSLGMRVAADERLNFL